VIFSESEPADARRLRADFEPPSVVLLVSTKDWPRTTERIAEQVLDSGTELGLVREAGSSQAAYTRLLTKLEQRPGARVTAYLGSVDTPWVRDWGPLQLVRGDRSLWLDADHSSREHDDAATAWLSDQHGVDVAALAWALDGGAFISDGAGLCVLSLEYLEQRGITRDGDGAQLGQLLGQLGCKASVLVPTLVDEHTKHVDMIAQFVGPTRLMIAEIHNGGDSEDTLRLRAAELGIRQAAAALGRSLEIIHVPTPPSEPGSNPRTYVNGLRLPDRYLMPSYPELGVATQRRALAAVQLAMGAVPVVAIDASEMIAAGGALHCASLGMFVP
jgi:agmatine/peptidylarginine deiminase